jgi:hypothetical protein
MANVNDIIRDQYDTDGSDVYRNVTSTTKDGDIAGNSNDLESGAQTTDGGDACKRIARL